jgi:hypothetical protein
MRPVLRGSALTAAVLVLLATAGSSAPSDRDAARAFLAATFGLTASEFTKIDAGEVFAKGTAAGDTRDIATFGIVRVRITPAFYVERLADIVSFKKDDAVVQIGVFGRPPALRDVEALSLDEPDLRSLRECRVGHCGLQLPADTINRFRAEVDWGRADAPQRANGLIHQMLVDYVTRYQQAGAGATMLYADRDGVMNVRSEFLSLAASDAGGWGRFNVLRRHFVEYPGGATPDARDLVYWSKEIVSRKTVASVTHLAILPCAADSPAAFAVGSMQIYGSHYFDASFGLTVLVPDPSSASPATYVAYMNRSRVDVIGGVFGGVAKKIIASKARSTVGDTLGRLRTRLEREFAASSSTGPGY